ncbi:hypothetical protein ABPG77_003165 [Micractinium sp. CCAP 211/92]
MTGGDLGYSDSLGSAYSNDEHVLELTSRLMSAPGEQALSAAFADHCRARKRKRIDEQQEYPLPAGQHSGRGVPAAAPSRLARDAVKSAPGASASLGPLGCAEAHDCLDEADCSSVATEEGFVVYQSPLSLAAQGERRAGGDGVARDASAPPAPPVLVEQLPPRLASDPDLAEMLSVLCEGESELQPIAGFLDHHGPTVSAEHFLDASMRRTATSWLVEVASEFGLHQETLFLGVALLDRFLSSSRGVPRTQLQLVAVACMLIASKHEEEMHPSVLDFTNIADNCFVPGDLLRMEAIVLDCLSFRVNTPTAHTFLSMYKQALGLQPRTCALASYLAELALLEYDVQAFRPSQVASAATLMAQLYLGDTESLSHLPAVARCSVDQLRPCLRRLLAMQQGAHTARDYSSPYLPVRDKYRGPQWLCVACTTPYASSAALVSAFVAAGGDGGSSSAQGAPGSGGESVK